MLPTAARTFVEKHMHVCKGMTVTGKRHVDFPHRSLTPERLLDPSRMGEDVGERLSDDVVNIEGG